VFSFDFYLFYVVSVSVSWPLVCPLTFEFWISLTVVSQSFLYSIVEGRNFAWLLTTIRGVSHIIFLFVLQRSRSQTFHGTPILWTTENRVRSNYCRGMIFCMIVNHCEKVLLNSFLSFKGQGHKLRVFHGTIILVPQQIL
jgi:hypothetical protein